MAPDFLKNLVYAFLGTWVGNMACYILAQWLGWWDLSYVNPKNNMVIDWKTITYVSIVLIILAALLFWVIMKLVFRGKMYFFALFGMVLFFLAISVLGMPGLPNKMAAVMLVMTISSAFCILYFLSKIDLAEY